VLPLLLAAAVVLAALVPLAGLVAAKGLPGAEVAAWLNPTIATGFAVALLAFAAGWVAVHQLMVRPLEALAQEAAVLAAAPQPRAPLLPTGRHLLGALPGSVGALSQRLVAAGAETEAAVAAATRRTEEQKSRLEAILLDLTEGVIVCNARHDILLYNQAAQRILGLRDALGLGRPLFGVLTREPVLHTLEQLARPASEREATRRFVCATVDLGTLLEARLSLVREGPGEPAGYVISFADAGPGLEALALRDQLLRELMVDWRRPLANLTAAAEMLALSGETDSADRAAFEEVVAKEAAGLNARFQAASRRYDRLAAGPWPMADIHSLDLFRAASKHLAEGEGIAVTPVGLPLWLHADSHSLLLALEHLLRRLAAHTGARQLDIEAVKGESYGYVEIAWQGEPVAAATLESWLGQPLEGTIANRTVRQIVERHGSELWSRARPGGSAVVRLPLRLAERVPADAGTVPAAPRPEYYDFDLFRSTDGTLAETPLRHISAVVFDTETTGLKPSAGDALLAIGAVRVVNGRILTGETFDRLVDPGRDIPPASIRIHGITPEAVKGKPPARIVLPQFKSFTGDAVLIAYNAAFDMRFLELAQEQAGVVFDNPVLDALLLAIYLHKDAPDHSLGGMARLLGVEVAGRHTALGDAMTTAAVWLRLLDLLEARGIVTFGEAVKVSSRMMQERKALTRF
jgi:DNA polymerase-3 subunit epsilon